MLKHNKVIIIGAGMAGLAAGSVLQQHSQDFIILEAMDRVGGRIVTDEKTFGFPVDLGAFVIHGTKNNPITDVCEHYNIKHQLVDLANAYLKKNKTIFPIDKIAGYNNQFFDGLSKLTQSRRAKNASDQSLYDSILEWRNYQADPLLLTYVDWLTQWLSLWFGIGVNHISSHYWDFETSLEGGNHIVLPGYGQLVNQLSNSLDIKCNTVVKSINYLDSCITVESDKGCYTADYVIVTVPLGVLKQEAIIFNPPLSALKQTAIDCLGFGSLMKIVLEFDICFWPESLWKIAALDNTVIPSFANYRFFSNKNILVGFAGGEYAKDLEDKSDQEIIALALQALRAIFGDGVTFPINYLITRWGKEPYIRGAYSYPAIDSYPEHYHILSQSVNDKLFFGGEATHIDFPATVHGAYLSGVREANNIIEIVR